MKKVFFFAAALVAMVACNKSESISLSNPEEIAFFTMTKNATRGFICTSAFQEVTNPDTTDFNSSLTGTPKGKYAWREMVVAAYNEDDSEDYFPATVFARRAENLWGGKDQSLYWPIGKELQFLAYSSKNITDSSNVVRPELDPIWSGSKKVSFEVSPLQCYQNDIVYAQASGNNRGTPDGTGSNSGNGLAIEFSHAQAWLTFNVRAAGADKDTAVVHIDKIVLEDVYNSGVLTLSYNDTSVVNKKAIAKWNFFSQNPTDVVVDDPWKATDKGKNLLYEKSSINGLQLNMLMPPQKHNAFVLYYTMNDEQQGSVVLPFDTGNFDETHYYINESTIDTAITELAGKSKEWVMGYHYIYNITISINEITFAPEVKAWVEVTGFDFNPQNL